MSLTSAGLSIAATTGAEPGLKHDLNAPALPESSEDHVSNGPSDQQAKEDTLQNTTATADVTTPPTTPTNTLTPKRSRRSSKLFGKLVPKFLQTSLGPSNSVSQSPQSAHPTSSSPSRLGRLGRSASFAGGSSSSLLSTRSVTKPDPVMEEDEEDSNKERAGLSVATTSETASSETASINDDTLVKPGSPDISIVDSGCDQTLESDRQEEAVDDDADGYQYNIVKETEDYHSPYIIDENCDDDFFLNSVLRKKSQPSSPSMLSTAWSSSPSLERMPSLTFSTDSTMSSSHSSLTSSTPSPTTPTHSFSIGASSPRSYALSVMIQPGLDEKRSRLTDAVREWRRSTNASAGSVHSSYSGFAM
ncbi:hypothetical protein BGX34_002744 [Mortierella sp. NVP85]|nr:hypothetical protein BGX34_002744 [Mortierella sp. NVP85]